MAKAEHVVHKSCEHTARRFVVAGMIPPDHYDFLQQAGCFDVYGPGTKIPVATHTIITRLMKEY